MDIKIIIAAHKPTDLPDDPLYFPVFAGAELQAEPLPYPGDNTGDHISAKNRSYCELTALYWAWKNLDAEYLGICHYRRFFRSPAGRKILTAGEAEAFLQRSPVLLPRKRQYYIETNYTQYIHAHQAEGLDITRRILAERSCAETDWAAAFDRVMGRTGGHRFNMLIMRRDLLDAYCTWLFDILNELEKQLDITGYDAYSRRVFGFVGERLLDVWLEGTGTAWLDIPYFMTQKQNWPRKLLAFLGRKFFPQLRRNTKEQPGDEI